MIDIENMWEILIAIMLACSGGFARLLSTKGEQAIKWSGIFSEIFISGFSGLMILLLAQSLNILGSWQGIACGMAGWVGPRFLDLISKMVMNLLGLGKDAPTDKDKKE